MPLAIVALHAFLLASGEPASARPRDAGPDLTPPAAAAGAASPAAADAAPLAGCIATRDGRDGAWRYACKGALAAAEDDARALDPGAYLDEREAAIRHAEEGAATFTRERAVLAGQEATLLVATAARGRRITVAVLSRPQGTRAVSCFGRAERCAPILEALAAAPWRAGPAGAGVRRSGEGDPRLGDAGPPVPAGCRAMPTFEPGLAGMISCAGKGHAAWARAFDRAALARLRDDLVAKVIPRMWPGEREPEDVPCRLGGVDATCSRLTHGSGPDRVVAMWGETTVEGVSWFAQCRATGEEPLPSPCSWVFGLR